MNRQYVEEMLDEVEQEDLSKPLEKVIGHLQKLQSKYSNFKNLRLEPDHYYYNLLGDRLETNEEVEERIEHEKWEQEEEKKCELETQENELKEYKRLKKKFEKWEVKRDGLACCIGSDDPC